MCIEWRRRRYHANIVIVLKWAQQTVAEVHIKRSHIAFERMFRHTKTIIQRQLQSNNAVSSLKRTSPHQPHAIQFVLYKLIHSSETAERHRNLKMSRFDETTSGAEVVAAFPGRIEGRTCKSQSGVLQTPPVSDGVE